MTLIERDVTPISSQIYMLSLEIVLVERQIHQDTELFLSEWNKRWKHDFPYHSEKKNVFDPLP